MTINKENGHSHVHSSLLIPIIHKALSACKWSRPSKRATSTFLENLWYDEECKATKRSLKEGKLNKENKRKYEKLVQSKREDYVNTRRKELISLGKYNPKGFWRELQQRKEHTKNRITDVQWLEYARLLYERLQKKDTPPIVETSMELFRVKNIN